LSFVDTLDQALWDYDSAGNVVRPEDALVAAASDAIDRRELLSALAKLQARWVNQLGGRGTRTVRLTPEQEEIYLVQVRQLFDQLRRDRPSLAAVTDAQIEMFARAGLVMAFNPHQRRGPDGRWIKMDVSELKSPRRRGTPTPEAPQLPTPAPSRGSHLRPGEPEIGPDGKYAKPTKQYATWNGRTYTRTSRNPYRYAAVVASQDNPEGAIWSWHRTAESARRGSLEGAQRGHFYVKDIVETGFEPPAAPTMSASQAVDEWAARMRADHPDLKLDIAQTGAGPVVLSRIVLPKASRGKGTGSEIMRSLTDLADERGLTLALTPSGDYGGSVARLRRFYESFGFVRNKGKNRNYDTTEDYVRPPKPRATVTAAQRALFELAFNPHQRRGPDGRWIRMPTVELKGPRRGKGRSRVKHVEFEHRDGRPVYKVGGRERNWTPAEARAIADALDATADGQSVDAPVRGRVVTDGAQRRTIEQVQPFRNNKGGVTLDVGRDRGRDGSGEVELTDTQARALAKDLREAADRHEAHGRAAATPAPLDPPEYAAQLPPVNLPDPQIAYRADRDAWNDTVKYVALHHQDQNSLRKKPDESLDHYLQQINEAQTVYERDEATEYLERILRSYYDGNDQLDPRPDPDTYLNVPSLPPGPRTTGGTRPPVSAPLDQRAEALDRSVRSGLESQQTLAGGAIGDTRRVRLGDGTEAIYKRAKRPVGPVTPQDQTDAEGLASLVAEAVGVRAPAVKQASSTELYMEVMPGTSAAAHGWRTAPYDVTDSDQGIKLGLLDVLLNNSDRHTGNWMWDDGRLAAIDHGFAFQPGNSRWMSSPFTDRFNLTGYDPSAPLTPGDVAIVRQRLERLRPQFETAGRGDWYREMLMRLNRVDAGAKENVQSLYPHGVVTAAQRAAFAARGILGVSDTGGVM